MKKTVLFQLAVLLMSCIIIDTMAQGITTPRTPSPAAMIKQTIGISTVTVDYSRPKVGGRSVWGDLVPYGWKSPVLGIGNVGPWRAGANENTVIQFSDPVKVEGQLVPAGSYGLFFVVNQDNTGEVVLSKEFRSWGSFSYDPKQDQLRAKIQLRDVAHIEILTYEFINLTKNSGELVLNWEKKQFPVKIEFAVDEIVMANAKQELKGVMGFGPEGYTSAANYALINNINQEQALGWIDQAIRIDKSFQTMNIKAMLLKRTGKTSEADKLMSEAIVLGNENDLNNYGYQLLADKQYDKAIEVMVLNTKKFPSSANAWDSLGEIYAAKGDKNNAIKSFKKSLTLNPPEATKANSEKFLKQLGAM